MKVPDTPGVSHTIAALDGCDGEFMALHAPSASGESLTRWACHRLPSSDAEKVLDADVARPSAGEPIDAVGGDPDPQAARVDLEGQRSRKVQGLAIYPREC